MYGNDMGSDMLAQVVGPNRFLSQYLEGFLTEAVFTYTHLLTTREASALHPGKSRIILDTKYL